MKSEIQYQNILELAKSLAKKKEKINRLSKKNFLPKINNEQYSTIDQEEQLIRKNKLIQKKEEDERIFHSKLDLNYIIKRSRYERINSSFNCLGDLPSKEITKIRIQVKNKYSSINQSQHRSISLQGLSPPNNLNLPSPIRYQKPKNIFLSNQSSITSLIIKSDIFKENSTKSERHHYSSDNEPNEMGTKIQFQKYSSTKKQLPKIKEVYSEEFLKHIFMKITKSDNEQNLHNLRLLRSQFRAYLLIRYGEKITDRFMNFFEITNSLDFYGYIQLRELLSQTSCDQWNYLFFFFYDKNEDRLICNSDIFQTYTQKTSSQGAKESIGRDLLRIYRFVQSGLNQMDHTNIQLHNLQWSKIMTQQNMNMTQLRKCLNETGRKSKTNRNTIFLSNFGATEFFVNQNMEKMSGMKDLVIENKPFHFTPEQAFSINYLHFQEIFSINPPHLFDDILNYLGMGDPDICNQMNDIRGEQKRKYEFQVQKPSKNPSQIFQELLFNIKKF